MFFVVVVYNNRMKQKVKDNLIGMCLCVCVCAHDYMKFIYLQLQYFGRVYCDLFSVQMFQHPFLYKSS